MDTVLLVLSIIGLATAVLVGWLVVGLLVALIIGPVLRGPA